ncbi:hypothetical protein SLS53_000183 [Cytospora paraplurivora]|uniref:Uncharacterized protein n=1 Tax=Cytospora paraplurivora TaxID=2898453 RepID=A0AAN9UKK9_9PEZI
MEDFEDLAIRLRAEVGKLAKRAAATVLPLWVIIITVIIGTGLLALFLGFFCLFVCRRRRGNKSGRFVLLDGIPALASDGGSSKDERERGRGKLRKRQRYAAGGGGSGEEDGIDDVEGEIGFREISPVRKVSMLVMPDIFLRRGSLNPFAGAGAGGGGGSVVSSNTRYGNGGSHGHGHRRIMSNAWIDEDTLHGPKMTSALADQAINRKAKKKSWRRSIRESWPLKTLSPTLPRLAQFDADHGGADEGMHDSMTMLYFGSHSDRILPELPPPPGLVTRGYDGQGSPPRPLPKPPRKGSLATNGTYAVGDAVPRARGLSYYRYEGTDEPVKSTNSLRVKPGGGVGVESGAGMPRGGHLNSAGSTLSVILKDTEMRLQEVARRNRSSASPPKSTPVGQDVSTVTLVDSGPRTPSPTKSDKPSPVSAEAASAHARQTSDASVLSEADSMVGDPSPAPQYHGLTSPSRSKPQQQKQSPHRKKLSRTASLTSSVDSSLSDISEEKSMVSGTTPNTTAPNSSRPADMNKLADFVSGDPFTATSDTTTPSSNKAGPRSRGVYAASRGGHGASDQQRGRHTSEETLFAISQSPLSLISGNSRSPDPSPTRVADRANKIKTPQPAVIHFPAPPSRNNPSDDIHKKASAGQSEPASVPIPDLSLVSPSVERDSPTPKRTGVLGRLDHMPTLVHGSQSQDREKSPEIVPPSPALSSVYDCYAALHSPNPSSSSPFTVTPTNRRRAAGEVRNISDETSSSYYSEQAYAHEKQKAAALNELNVLLKQETTANTTTSKSIQVQPWGTVRLVPPEQQVYGGRTLKVSATVAELRRMNSQVSAHSVTASGYSDDSAAVTPRPEVVSPPRKGAAARNYLALGSLPETSPRSGARAGHHDKENDRAGGKKARVELDENVRLRPGGGAVAVTPTRNRRNERKAQMMEEGGRRSEESLGLYDEDGFLISPERRLGLRT